MRKRLISGVLSVVLTFSLSTTALAEEVKVEREKEKVQAIKKLENLSNEELKLREKDGQVFLSGKLSNEKVPGEDAAVKFLEENKALLGIDDVNKELKILDMIKDELGYTIIKFVQVIEGTEVEGTLMNVHFDENGIIVSVNGNLEENKEIKELGSKNISDKEAIEIAKKQFEYKELKVEPKAEKMIINKDNKNYETYKVNIYYTEPTRGSYDVFVEINSGQVIKIESKIRFNTQVVGSGIDVLGQNRELKLSEVEGLYGMLDLTNPSTEAITTYDMNNSTSEGFVVSNSTPSFTEEFHKASVSAHYNAEQVIDFYKELFNRNSLDNNGMKINSFTHYDYNYNNAFWDGYEMIYGDGDGEKFTYLSGDLDIVGHEMTHGVIDYTAALDYHNQSGALNESMADVFGVLIATYDKYDVANGGSWNFERADWVVGDDVYTPNIKGDALRSLSSPTIYYQPEHMDNYEYLLDTEEEDWGGVHINSGIPNKAAYNIASVIGMDKTARIYYRALNNYMTPNTDFEQARSCIVQSAKDLYEGDQKVIDAVKNGFDLVGILDFTTVGEKPVISGAEAKNVKAGDAFNAKDGVTALDSEDGDLTSQITISGEVDTKKIGKYTLTYSVTDSDGNRVSKNRIITVTARNVQVTSLIGSDRYDTAVRLSKGQFSTANTIMIANGAALADGLAATPLATYKKAPLLLTEVNTLPEITKNEIKRLGAKNAIIVGGSGVVSDKVIGQLKSLGITTVERLGGATRYETSLKIAQYIDKNCYDISKVVISNGHGEADALSIASAAGRDKMAILLVDRDSIPTNVYNWIKGEDLENAYIIGGTGVVSDSVLNKVNGVTKANIANNRLGGKNRFVTNAMVIDKFYGNVMNKTYIAKGWELIDALAAGPVAAANGSPVILADSDLSSEQKTALNKRYGNIIIRTGGGISDKAVNTLKNCLQQ